MFTEHDDKVSHFSSNYAIHMFIHTNILFVQEFNIICKLRVQQIWKYHQITHLQARRRCWQSKKALGTLSLL